MVDRRDFLKIWWLSAIAWLLPSLPNSDSNKDRVEETLDSESEKNSTTDMIMAYYMTFLFGGKIVPNFMSGDTVWAVKTAWIKWVLPYLSFSSPTARKKWIDEYKHSIVWVTEIVWALNMADLIHIDYHEKMTNFIKSQHKNNWTNKELLGDSIVKQWLQKYNLIVSEESDPVVSVESEKIKVSREFLEENITVFFRNPDDFLENLKSHISDESIATETEKLFNEDRTSWENMPEDGKKWIMDKLIKKDVIELKDRINFLTGFIFITPFLTWVGQANQLKKEIKHISNWVKELYISAWFAEDMAIWFGII